MSKSFKFWPELWLNNRSLRLCSPSARGFWVDVMALCFPSGYLVTASGEPIDDVQLAKLVGETPAKVKGWIAELGQAGIFGVDDDGRLFVSRMVKASAPKVATASVKRKPKAVKKQVSKDVQDEHDRLLSFVPVEVIPQIAEPAKKPSRTADWWLTPAGWAAKGNSQACGIKPGESLEDFQIRLSVKLPPGPHIEALSDYQKKMVDRNTPKDPNAKQ